MEMWYGIRDLVTTVMNLYIALMERIRFGDISMFGLVVAFMVINILITLFWRGGGAKQ